MSSTSPFAAKRIQTIRDLISAARREGCEPADLLLQVSRAQAAELKRDGSVATDEIRFMGGQMHFLGVRVTEGDVSSPALARLAEADGQAA